MISSNQCLSDIAKGGIGLYEDLPTTTVPIKLYLDTVVRIVKDPTKRIRNIADLLYNHEVS